MTSYHEGFTKFLFWRAFNGEKGVLSWLWQQWSLWTCPFVETIAPSCYKNEELALWKSHHSSKLAVTDIIFLQVDSKETPLITRSISNRICQWLLYNFIWSTTVLSGPRMKIQKWKQTEIEANLLFTYESVSSGIVTVEVKINKISLV